MKPFNLSYNITTLEKIIFILLCCTLINPLFSQSLNKIHTGSGAPGFGLPSAELGGFEYQLELFPGQVFQGNYYYWSSGGTNAANFQFETPVSWLTISPSGFTSASCSDIHRVLFDFVAPQTPGIYTATIQDLNGNWDNTIVTLSVTENPLSALTFSYQVNDGNSISRFDTLAWNGFGQFGCQNNYIPGNSKLFKYTQRDSVPWFSITPSEITVSIFSENVIESVVTGDTSGNDFVYIIAEEEYYHLCLFFKIELQVITDVENNEQSELPEEFTLEQNYPNPFNPSTTIKYSIPISEFITLKIYGVLGNEVATLVNEEKPAGSYEVEFDASMFSSGIYFYNLQIGSFNQTKKMILLR